MRASAHEAPPPLVVALGGNALIRPGEIGTPAEQAHRVDELAPDLVQLAGAGGLVITHGNGPQVGRHLLRSDLLQEQVPPTTLELAVASTQAEIGFIIVQAMDNELRRSGLQRTVLTVVTRVLVDAADPAFGNPTKFIGRFMDRETAETQAASLGWRVRQDGGRGWRRVVPSPAPLEVMELELVRELAARGHVVVACGGGGVPVVRAHGDLAGVEAVIDKDRASALLAAGLGARRFVILTAVDEVWRDFGTPRAAPLGRIHAEELAALHAEGQFPDGSMGPKIEAALDFLRGGGEEVLITSPEALRRALDGAGGTHVLR